MKKNWKRPALNTAYRAAEITFTVNKVDDHGIIDFVQINRIYIYRPVYNEILRNEKIQNLINGDGKITVQDMYFAMLKYAEDYHIELVNFKKIT